MFAVFFSSVLVIKTLDPDPYPDSLGKLDPDPYSYPDSVRPDPQPCLGVKKHETYEKRENGEGHARRITALTVAAIRGRRRFKKE